MRGQGTVNDPYVLTTVADVQAIPGNATGYYVLANDIDFAGASFSSITGRDFKGILDGKYHKLSNAGGHEPLFVTITGIVKNLGLENLNLINTEYVFFGALCCGASLGAFIEKCWSSGSLKNQYDPPGHTVKIGGLCGYVGSANYDQTATTISKCFSNVTMQNIMSQSSMNAGGICAEVLDTYTGGSYIEKVTLNQLVFAGKVLDINGALTKGGPIYGHDSLAGTYNWGKKYPGFTTSNLFCFSDMEWGSAYWNYDDNYLGYGTIHNTDSQFRTELNTSASRLNSSYTGFDFLNDWVLNNNINFWKPALRRFGITGAWATTVKSVIEGTAMQAIRDYIQSHWSYVELSSYDGVLWKRLSTSDSRVSWTHTAGAQTMKLTIVIKGTDPDVVLPLKIGKISLFNVATGGSALVSELFTEQSISIIENVFTLTYQLQIPKVG